MPHKAKGNGKVQATEPCSSPVGSPCPARLTYALKAWTVERRSDGWHVSLTTPDFGGEKPGWRGPFETIETACLSIARGQAVKSPTVIHGTSSSTRSVCSIGCTGG